MAERDDEDRETLSPAVLRFAEYIARVDGGEGVDFDAFCGEHPELAPRLRQLHESWVRAGVLGAGGAHRR